MFEWLQPYFQGIVKSCSPSVVEQDWSNAGPMDSTMEMWLFLKCRFVNGTSEGIESSQPTLTWTSSNCWPQPCAACTLWPLAIAVNLDLTISCPTSIEGGDDTMVGLQTVQNCESFVILHVDIGCWLSLCLQFRRYVSHFLQTIGNKMETASLPCKHISAHKSICSLRKCMEK
jgi:hypothetical protein